MWYKYLVFYMILSYLAWWWSELRLTCWFCNRKLQYCLNFRPRSLWLQCWKVGRAVRKRQQWSIYTRSYSWSNNRKVQAISSGLSTFPVCSPLSLRCLSSTQTCRFFQLFHKLKLFELIKCIFKFNENTYNRKLKWPWLWRHWEWIF